LNRENASSFFVFHFVSGHLVLNFSSGSDAVIRDTEAIEHPGQYVTVEGTVVAVFTSTNGNTFLSFGAAYPNQTFGGWIVRDSELARVSTVAGLAGKKLRITGTIELYKGKPAIRISSTKQIQQDED